MTEAVYVDALRQPYFSPVYIPELSTLHLSADEQAAISRLQMRMWRQRYLMELADSYYRGMQVIQDLNIAIPPELSGLRVIVGWPRIAVDPYVERLSCDGFRLPGATDVNQELSDVWLENRMDAEQSLSFTDALVMGRSWILGGSPEETGGVPKLSVESPLNIAATWDVRTSKPKELLQSYWLDDRRHAALYLPNETVHVGEDDNGMWQITDRDQHNFGLIPGARMANAPRASMRDGASEITPELMSVTDAACRTLLNLDVAGQFYSVPQKLILGAAESDFQNPDGTSRSAWQTYLSHILALERDEDGNIPQVHQFTAYDPSVYTKVIEMYASQAAGILGAPPQDLGLYTHGNPISADAAQVSEGRRDRRAVRMQSIFGTAVREGMQIAVRFMNNGELPDEYRRMAIDWADVKIPNVAGTADALFKYIDAGTIPAASDVTLKRAGFNAVERAQLEQDRLADQGAQFLQEVAHSLTAKAARADQSLTRDLTGGGPPRANPSNVVPPTP